MLSSPSRKHFVSMDVPFFKPQSYFSSLQTPLQEESKIEEDFLTPQSYFSSLQTPSDLCLSSVLYCMEKIWTYI
jgi:hypothetical protein